MKLCDLKSGNREEWIQKGYELPQFDRDEVRRKTSSHPRWVHFGAGNIFRAFPANLQQKLLDAGEAESGIIVAESYDMEIIDKAYRPYDNLSLLAVLNADGSIQKRVIASVTESLKADPAQTEDWDRLCAIFENESLQMVSFTITEKGYAYLGDDGIIARVTELCRRRFVSGAFPLALVSMDNCSHNGEKLFLAVKAVTERWISEGKASGQFFDYLCGGGKVSFPWSMIDKITPRPDAAVRNMLKETGFADTDLIVTEKKTYTAPFVNAEEAEYLVVEDDFTNCRPKLEKAGVIFTDRETVNKVERMKVCTCLNPLHTALAVFGCLLSYTSIREEMTDHDLVGMVRRLGFDEGMPVVTDPKIISPEDFLNEVLEVRLPNPFMPDTPQRIATDTSQKLPIRFGETVKSYLMRGDLDIESLEAVPLVFAGWCRYLMGIDDGGKPFAPSPDPRLGEISAHLKEIKLGDRGPFHDALFPILSDATIFGVNLYQAGLGEKTEQLFERLVQGTGAVRRVLHELFC